jgi:hypothetical protein
MRALPHRLLRIDCRCGQLHSLCARELQQYFRGILLLSLPRWQLHRLGRRVCLHQLPLCLPRLACRCLCPRELHPNPLPGGIRAAKLQLRLHSVPAGFRGETFGPVVHAVRRGLLRLVGPARLVAQLHRMRRRQLQRGHRRIRVRPVPRGSVRRPGGRHRVCGLRRWCRGTCTGVNGLFSVSGQVCGLCDPHVLPVRWLLPGPLPHRLQLLPV